MQIGICMKFYTASCPSRLELPRVSDSALPQSWWVLLWWWSPVQWLSVVVWLLVLRKLQVGYSSRSSAELVAETDGQTDAIPMENTVLLQLLKGARRKLFQPIQEPRLGGRLQWRSMPAWKWCLDNYAITDMRLCSSDLFVDLLRTACEGTSKYYRSEEEWNGRENKPLFWGLLNKTLLNNIVLTVHRSM
jgi:hypothetical protein